MANSYPGCAVDVPSHLYSFSFAPNPDWTRRFACRDELLEYTRSIVGAFAFAFALGPHLHLGTALLGASFDEDGGYWRVRTSGGEFSARSLVMSTGPLSRPAIPRFPGLDSFAGAMFHSSRWRHDVDLRGKQVAVVGTGASAVQFIPELVGGTARLDVYQRSAPWILPRPDRPFRPRREVAAGAIGSGSAPVPRHRLSGHEARALALVFAPGCWAARGRWPCATCGARSRIRHCAPG